MASSGTPATAVSADGGIPETAGSSELSTVGVTKDAPAVVTDSAATAVASTGDVANNVPSTVTTANASPPGTVANDTVPQKVAFARKWTDRRLSIAPGQRKIRVMTLNILADGLAHGSESAAEGDIPCPPMFQTEGEGGCAYLDEEVPSGKTCFRFRCNVEAIKWKRRWPMIQQLLREHDPDVIGLQEVDISKKDGNQWHKLSAKDSNSDPAHEQEIKSDLSKIGYDGRFACKQGRATDGVAVFWSRKRLRPLEGLQVWKLRSSVHVALAQSLLLDGVFSFTAVVTHLKAGVNQNAEDMRFQQATALLELLKPQRNVVLLADLNAHCRAFTSYESYDSRYEEGKDQPEGRGPPQKITVQTKSYPLICETLQSAYKTILGDEPSFTCWGGWTDREVRGVFDYIFVKGGFKVQRVLEIPTSEQVCRFAERLPNPLYPSDHFPLLADLLIDQSAIGTTTVEQSSFRPPSSPSTLSPSSPAKRLRTGSESGHLNNGWQSTGKGGYQESGKGGYQESGKGGYHKGAWNVWRPDKPNSPHGSPQRQTGNWNVWRPDKRP